MKLNFFGAKKLGLKNDHKALSKQIEQDLFALHANEKKQYEAEKLAMAATQQQQPKQQAVEVQQPSQQPPQQQRQHQIQAIPFLLVNSVAPDSPAQEAGLLQGDLVLQFGSIDASVYAQRGDKAMIQQVEQSLNKPLRVQIKRNNAQTIELELVPKKWSGRGYLGCHLIKP